MQIDSLSCTGYVYPLLMNQAINQSIQDFGAVFGPELLLSASLNSSTLLAFVSP